MKNIRDAIGAETGEHPTYEMLRDVVDGTADDVTREIVESHAEVCAMCAEDLRDLRAFAEGPARAAAWPRYAGAAAAAIALVFVGLYFGARTSRPQSAGVAPAGRTVIGRERPITAGVDARAPYGRADWDAAVRDALATGTIDAPHQQWPAADPLRGTDQKPAPEMSPAHAVIESATPVLTWRAAPGRYVVTVYDGSTRVAQSPPLESSQWQVTPPLARGRTYAWQVEIRRGGNVELIPAPPAPPALFRVLDETSFASLADARRRFPNDHLLLGVLSARAGLQQEAADELRTYAVQHPEARKVVIR